MASAYIPESLGSLEGDDDKIYFFFSETGQEFEFFENTIVSRVARICKVSPRRLRKAPRAQGQDLPGGLLLSSRRNSLADGVSLLLFHENGACAFLLFNPETQNGRARTSQT